MKKLRVPLNPRVVAAVLLVGTAYIGVTPVSAEENWCDDRCLEKYGVAHYHFQENGEVEIHEYQGCSGNIFYVTCYYA